MVDGVYRYRVDERPLVIVIEDSEVVAVLDAVYASTRWIYGPVNPSIRDVLIGVSGIADV